MRTNTTGKTPRKLYTDLVKRGCLVRLQEIRAEDADVRRQLEPLQKRSQKLKLEHQLIDRELKTLDSKRRPTMTDEERAAVSDRMKKFWAKRRRQRKKAN